MNDKKRSDQIRKRDKLNIIAYLDPTEGGCNYSKYFNDNFLVKGNLHPDVMKVKRGVISIKSTKEKGLNEVNSGVRKSSPKVILMNGQVELLRQEGNRINVPEFQQYILRHIGWEESNHSPIGSEKCTLCNQTNERLLGEICGFEKCPKSRNK